jgi:uncharacterized RDD family membrane protein YckC
MPACSEHSRTIMKVQIQTTQNVDIEYDLAGIGERVGAGVIDMLIQIGYVVGVIIIATSVLSSSDLDSDFMTIVMVVLYLPLFFYHLLCEIFLNGQSFGKKAVSIKVVRTDGTQPGISAYLLRWLIGLIETSPLSFGMIAIITILVNGKGQRLGDIAAGTTVVKIKPAVTLDQTIFAQVDEDYTPTFHQVTRLSDQDVATIKEVLESREQRDNPVVLGTLVRKVKEVLGVESDMTPVKFLRTVIKDYNYYTAL